MGSQPPKNLHQFFETNTMITKTVIDENSTNEEFEKYVNGLKYKELSECWQQYLQREEEITQGLSSQRSKSERRTIMVENLTLILVRRKLQEVTTKLRKIEKL